MRAIWVSFSFLSMLFLLTPFFLSSPLHLRPFLLLQTKYYQHHLLFPSPPRSPSSPSSLLHVSDTILGTISSRLLSSLLSQASISSSPPSVVLLLSVAAFCWCESSLLPFFHHQLHLRSAGAITISNFISFSLQSTDQHLSGKPASPALRHLSNCCPVDWLLLPPPSTAPGGGDSSRQGRLLHLFTTWFFNAALIFQK